MTMRNMKLVVICLIYLAALSIVAPYYKIVPTFPEMIVAVLCWTGFDICKWILNKVSPEVEHDENND